MSYFYIISPLSHPPVPVFQPQTDFWKLRMTFKIQLLHHLLLSASAVHNIKSSSTFLLSLCFIAFYRPQLLCPIFFLRINASQCLQCLVNVHCVDPSLLICSCSDCGMGVNIMRVSEHECPAQLLLPFQSRYTKEMWPSYVPQLLFPNNQSINIWIQISEKCIAHTICQSPTSVVVATMIFVKGFRQHPPPHTGPALKTAVCPQFGELVFFFQSTWIQNPCKCSLCLDGHSHCQNFQIL